MDKVDVSKYGMKPVADPLKYGMKPVSVSYSEEKPEIDNRPPYQRFLEAQPQSERMMQDLEPFGGGGEAGNRAALETGAFLVPQARMAKYIPQAPNVIKYLSNIAGHSLQSGALLGSLNALEGGDVRQGTEQGALIGGLISGSFPPIYKAYQFLRPSNLFRGNLSPEQLKNSLAITQGTETPLGDVLQNPRLKGFYENVLSNVPFSGANESMQRTANHIINTGDSLMSELLGNHSKVNVEGELYDTLISAKNFQKNVKNSFYNEPDKIAHNIKLNLELPSFSKLAQEYGHAIEDTNILKTEPEFRYLLNKLKNYESPGEEIKSKILSKEGKPIIREIKYPSLKEANILSSHLEDIANKYESSTNTAERNLSGVFRRLSTALKNDVRNAVNLSGDKNLISSFEKAEKNYAENYSPFLEKEIHKFASGKADPDLIVQAFIKTGKSTDRANLLEKFVKALPEEKRKLLGYAFLKRSYNNKGEFDPLAFKQLISSNSLGPRQFDLLFPGALGKRLKNYSELIAKNPEAFQLMRNPKTGARIRDVLPLGMAASGYAVGGPLGGILASIGGPIIANALARGMTSPRVREKLINKMLENHSFLESNRLKDIQTLMK